MTTQVSCARIRPVESRVPRSNVSARYDPQMTRIYSAREVAVEAGCDEDRVRWLDRLGLLTSDAPGRFTFGSILATKMVSALLESGLTEEMIEHAAGEGLLSFHRLDEYVAYQPGPRSERSFAQFQASLGSGGESLPTVYEVLGLPKPDPSTPIHIDEEEMLTRFLDVWRSAPEPESPIRAARLMAQGARAAMMGWAELVDEQLAEPARQRLLRGELVEFPDEVRITMAKATNLVPQMFLWLSARLLEHRSVNGIVEGFEQFLASRGLAPAPDPLGPPAIVFVDLSGFTRLTTELGDESAVRAAASLQRRADESATRHGGRLVKLLGDGALLRAADATAGVGTALDLVGGPNAGGAISSHAGVHIGPVIERDLDVFGQTVNLASRIADVAAPGEVLTSQDVAEAADGRAFEFQAVGDVDLKGISGPLPLFRASRVRVTR
jgi:adenylate cyclase